jgi:hypothetical protein
MFCLVDLGLAPALAFSSPVAKPPARAPPMFACEFPGVKLKTAFATTDT